ncbi:MAG: orotate phosphoribosyltransferase [Candidatus Rokubacteria bacterium]|nr:orotate phosphoribosyltransferase [Candidatus Rokubacteria bacterium]
MTWLAEVDVSRLYESRGALLRGHFRLSSGLHSGVYLQSALILQYPEEARRLGADLADRLRHLAPQTVVAPALGGILVAHEVARALGVRGLFTEREEGRMTLRRGFALGERERCLVVEDVVTTGGSTREVIACVEAAGARVVGVGALVDRSGGQAHFDQPFEALLRLSVPAYQPGDCPMCREGRPVVKPGSRPGA